MGSALGLIGKVHEKLGQLARFGFEIDAAAQFLQMAADQRQADAASRSLGGKSVFEDTRADRRIDAGAVVADDTV
ncbi:hypothetical protein AK51_22005 [Serratia nematodiphila DZ0503SBS1]|nr:hypothetical protein AK51_22005 [Serratia nematodiphila DZ0503SBS1]